MVQKIDSVQLQWFLFTISSIYIKWLVDFKINDLEECFLQRIGHWNRNCIISGNFQLQFQSTNTQLYDCAVVFYYIVVPEYWIRQLNVENHNEYIGVDNYLLDSKVCTIKVPFWAKFLLGLIYSLQLTTRIYSNIISSEILMYIFM